MKWIDWLIVAAVAVGAFFAARSVWKHRGNPCGSCRACEGWRDAAQREACRKPEKQK